MFGKDTETIGMKNCAKRNQSKTKGKKSVIKRYIMLLAVNPDTVQKLGLNRNAPEEVIKTIFHEASNLSHGSIHLTPKQKSLFKKDNAPITKLLLPEPTIKQ